MPRNSQCRRCSLWKTATNVCVWGEGESKVDAVLIGEAPGEAESRTGRPFMGRSGILLRATAEPLGKLYITNVVKCRPPENRTPMKDEIEACRPYLEEELASIQTRAVVPLGAVATKVTTGKSKITQVHGQLMGTDPITMPCFHPAYVLRDPSRRAAFEGALEKLARALRGEIQPSQIVEIVTTENFGQFIKAFERAPEFSFDTETTSLFPFDGKGRVRCLGIGLEEKAWVIPLAMPGAEILSVKGQRLLMEFLVELAQEKFAIAQNGKFDNQWLQHYYGTSFRLDFDTCLAEHTLDENRPQSLKQMVRAKLNEPEYDLSLKEKLSDENPQRVLYYCGLDAGYTHRISKLQRAELRQKAKTRRLFYSLVMPAARAFTSIDSHGMFVDLKRLEEVQLKTETELTQAERQLNYLAGEEINWNSPAQVARVLYQKLGLPIHVTTSTGAPSTSEGALITLKSTPIVHQLTKYRELSKFLSTYLIGWREHMVGEYLYLPTKLNGTVTGRYSSRLHQVPRDGRIRNLITAPKGWSFVQGDLSQAEVRVVASLSGDRELIRCFTEGIDVHWRTLLYLILVGGGTYVEPALKTATQIHGKRPQSISQALDLLLKAGHEAAMAHWSGWKEARKRAKGVVFGFIYGMFPPKFMEYALVKYGFEPTLEEATLAREAFFELYSGLLNWHDSQRRLARAAGEVSSPSGRVRHLPGVDSTDRGLRNEAERQAINSPVQGYIGDHKAMATVEIHETIPQRDLKIVAEHHDAILMRVRTSQLRVTLPKVKRIMESPRLLKELRVQLAVPLVAELEVGPWGAGRPFRAD